MLNYSVKNLNRASDAVKEVVRIYDIKQMYVPYYLCSSVRHALVEEGCKPVFYHINDKFMPNMSFDKKEFILYPNYFGVCSKNVDELERTYPKLIVDNAHSFFSSPQGLACFNAAYKFNLGDYALLYIKSDKKYSYEQINYKKEKNLRKKKFWELCEKYDDTNLIKPDKNSIPFCYPYLAETEKEADELVKNLENEGLTIYRYWEQLPRSYNEYKFYARLVPIPI